MALAREEVLRKVLHIFSGTIIPAGILYIPGLVRRTPLAGGPIAPWAYPLLLLFLVLISFVLVELVRVRVAMVGDLYNRLFGSMLRKEEAKSMTGATYIVAASFLCTLLFPRRPEVSAMALSTFIWGDGVAAIVGQSIGRIRIGKKSLEGSVACFVLCIAAFLFLFPAVPGVLDPWGGTMPLGLAVIASFTITALELIPFRLTPRIVINDNLLVPVVTGLVIKYFPSVGI
jgi:dolichol kinase